MDNVNERVLINMVDNMLLNKTPFKIIMNYTNWSEEEIWLYMDTCFRAKHPEFGKDNKLYCVWGLDDQNVKVKVR